MCVIFFSILVSSFSKVKFSVLLLFMLPDFIFEAVYNYGNTSSGTPCIRVQTDLDFTKISLILSLFFCLCPCPSPLPSYCWDSKHLSPYMTFFN